MSPVAVDDVKFIFRNKTYSISDEFPFLELLRKRYGSVSRYDSLLDVEDSTFEMYLLSKYLDSSEESQFVVKGVERLSFYYFKIVEAMNDYEFGAKLLDVITTYLLDVISHSNLYVTSTQIWSEYIKSYSLRLLKIECPEDLFLIKAFQEHITSSAVTPDAAHRLMIELAYQVLTSDCTLDVDHPDNIVRAHFIGLQELRDGVELNRARSNWVLLHTFFTNGDDSEDSGSDNDSDSETIKYSNSIVGYEFLTYREWCVIRQNGSVEVESKFDDPSTRRNARGMKSIADFVTEISEAELIPVY